MIEQDDMIIDSEPLAAEQAEPAERAHDVSENGGEQPSAAAEVSLAAELVSFAIKSVAVALAFIVLITCVLAVLLPLSTMRIMNELGMSERAVDFAEMYISRRLKEYGADKTSGDNGLEYRVLSKTPSLTDDDFIEALYVCTDLSYRLMEDYYAKGETGLGEYYAERLEKYTRMYLSLNNIAAVNRRKSELNISRVPLAAMRPIVYSYGHTVRMQNFRARAYLDSTKYYASNILMDTGIMEELAVRSNTYSGIAPPAATENRQVIINALDNFVDYIGCLSEYLDVEFLRIGVENDLGKKGFVPDLGNIDIVSSSYVMYAYKNKLRGNEFKLLFETSDGVSATDFGNIYNNLKSDKPSGGFKAYAQAAADFIPGNVDPEARLEEQLHQLYWLHVLSDFSRKLWYTSMLLFHSKDFFGQRHQAIVDADYDIQQMICVSYAGITNKQLSEVYSDVLTDYLANYNL